MVRHPGAVAILAITKDRRIVLERQFRPSIGRVLVEVPAGTLEPGEEPADCARRELFEETGFVAEWIRAIGSIYPAPGYSDEVLHLFSAGAGERSSQRLEEDEEIDILLASHSEAFQMVLQGAIADGKTLLLLQKAKIDPSILARPRK